jgi:hypothetical protein
MFLLETRFFKNTGRYGSVEIIFENSNALGGFCPRHWGIPIAMTMYYLLPNSDYRTAPRPPTGDWWCKRGHYFIKKKVFYRASLTKIFKKHVQKGILKWNKYQSYLKQWNWIISRSFQ